MISKVLLTAMLAVVAQTGSAQNRDFNPPQADSRQTGIPGESIVIPIDPKLEANCGCCGAKPQYRNPAWTPFIGTVAIVTQQRPQPGPLANQVIAIWDLHIKNGVPLNSLWSPSSSPQTAVYSDPAWNVAQLGDVFGAAVDGLGNIFVSATRVYGTANVGSLATGSPSQKAGQIYKISTVTGTPSAFTQLPNNGSGIGNLHFACEFNSLYATNFHDGLIYRINAVGNVQPVKWDHGLNLPAATSLAGVPLGRPAILGNDGSSPYAALGRRPWAVSVQRNRLWYSIWSDNIGKNTGKPNEIWSVALDVNGDPIGSARLEIALPPYAGNISNPVSDLRFGPMGTMMLAERSMSSNSTPNAHQSRALEYGFNGVAWVPNLPNAYRIGTYSIGSNSAGGVDYDFSPGGRTWITGDALHYPVPSFPFPTPVDYIYGIQGFPAGGGVVFSSILIDADNNSNQQNKTQLGIVRIPCPECSTPPMIPVISGSTSPICGAPTSYAVLPQAGVSYSWSVVGGAPTSLTGSTTSVNWSGGTNHSVLVTASGPGKCGAVSAFLNVAACVPAQQCGNCDKYNINLTMPPPLAIANGLISFVPTITSTMPSVLGVSVTVSSASVGFSAPACGSAGPVASAIVQALSSSIPPLNPPIVSPPNGNQATWGASSPISLLSGGTIPFQLQIPPSPQLPSTECRANFSFCMKVSLNNEVCKNCEKLQCFGPFPYPARGNGPAGSTDLSTNGSVPLVLPDGKTYMIPAGKESTILRPSTL